MAAVLGLAALLALVPALAPTGSLLGDAALASEFVAYAYLADPKDVAAAAKGGEAMERRMLTHEELIEDLGLDRRFNPPSAWRDKVGAFTRGERRGNDAAEGFVVMLALETVGERADPFTAGAPFHTFDKAWRVLELTGESELATFFRRLEEGNDVAPGEGRPSLLDGVLERSDYPVRVSIHEPGDAARYAKALRAWGGTDVDAVPDELPADEYWDREEAVEQLDTIEDYREELQAWLDASARSGRALFIFHEGG